MHLSTTVALTSLLLLPSSLASLYSKNSPVLQLDGRSYRDQIEKSNHTALVEFYAPWCGHCKNLQPAFEKAAKSLSGLAKVAAVNCDAEENKPFCGSMGVKGFPTLKLVRPGKKGGRAMVEDYNGGRTAKAMVDAVVEKIPNHVKRLKGNEYLEWIEGDSAKALLVSDKGTTSALLKALAVDFLGVIEFAQIRGDKDKAAAEMFGVEKLPTLVLVPSDGGETVLYSAEMKKEALVKFLSQAGSPNPDPAPSSEKKQKKSGKSSSKSGEKSKANKSSSAFSKASASHKSEDSSSAKATQTSETLEDASQPTASSDPKVADDETPLPVQLPDPAPQIHSLPDGLSLQQKCLNTKAGTCILALLPPGGTSDGSEEAAVLALSEIHHKHAQAKRNLFPVYQLPISNSQAAALRSKVNLGAGVEVLAVNGKRGWYRRFSPASSTSNEAFSRAEIETWVDAIRMGDLAKTPLPAGLLVPADQLPSEPVQYTQPEATESTAKTEGEEAIPIEVNLADDFDLSDREALMRKLREQLPEGMEFEVEEMEDGVYEEVLRGAEGRGEGEGGREEEVGAGHDEL
ncbi:hypothetical protein LTR62_006522 [Meristemomyces frigidus]|uniref:protein disulfide-isomerase n=1 Tax=Meristemomyces frigidus TaxID=1508187 RepID=A0AAN7TC62_9PEZI|nr:hypothetical protein LTR62_006522 [Meristemomyces frigidus]